MPHKTREGRLARCAVHNAVTNGKIPSALTLMCVDCGAPAYGYDHYLGYAVEHRLHLQPVCRACDGKRRMSRGEVKDGFRIGPRYRDGSFCKKLQKYSNRLIGPVRENGRFYSWAKKPVLDGFLLNRLNTRPYSIFKVDGSRRIQRAVTNSEQDTNVITVSEGVP